MSDDTFTLDAFIREERGDLPLFAAWWRSMNAIDADVFPLEMGAGDWGEQYLCFDAIDAAEEGIKARPLSIFTDEELREELARRDDELDALISDAEKEKNA